MAAAHHKVDNLCAIIDRNRLQIDGGTFNGNVIGGSNSAGSVIAGDIHLNINNGVFKGYVLGGGFAGTYNGDVYVTISGGDFSASKGVYAGFGSSSSSVSAGTHNTTVTLFGIDDENQFAQYTGVLSGGNDAGTVNWTTRTLDLKGYTAGEVKANLTSFSHVNVLEGTETTIKKSSDASDLGGATALQVDGSSSLELNADSADWSLTNVNVTVDDHGTLRKAGSYNVTLGNISGAGTLAVAEGNATVGTFADATANVASGSTLTVNLPSSDATLGTLSGAGSVELNGTIAGTNANMKFLMDNDWSGTVKLTGANISETGNVVLNLNNFGRAGSTIEINGLGTGKSSSSGDYLYQPDNAVVDANLRLTGDFTLTAGGSAKTYTFNGAWSGSGNFGNSYTGFSSLTYQLNGNMKDYSGTITLQKNIEW